MKTWCVRHDYMDEGPCPQCAQCVCENCKAAPSTENWGGMNDSVSLARNPRLVQRWCRRCVIVAQLAHMRPMIAKIQELELELQMLGSATHATNAEPADATRRSNAQK